MRQSPSQLLDAQTSRSGANGRDCTTPKFSTCLNSTAYGIADVLTIKRLHFMSSITAANCSQPFLTPFYSEPMRFAGTSAGTLSSVWPLNLWLPAQHKAVNPYSPIPSSSISNSNSLRQISAGTVNTGRSKPRFLRHSPKIEMSSGFLK